MTYALPPRSEVSLFSRTHLPSGTYTLLIQNRGVGGGDPGIIFVSQTNPRCNAKCYLSVALMVLKVAAATAPAANSASQ